VIFPSRPTKPGSITRSTLSSYSAARGFFGTPAPPAKPERAAPTKRWCPQADLLGSCSDLVQPTRPAALSLRGLAEIVSSLEPGRQHHPSGLQAP
jgi:hypothetical protein